MRSRDLERLAMDGNMPPSIRVLTRLYAWVARQRERLHFFIVARHYGREAEKAEAEIKRRDLLYGPMWRNPEHPIARRLAQRKHV